MSLADWYLAIYLFVLALVLALVGVVAWRRNRARQALTTRVQDLSLLADVGRAILDAPLDLAQLAEVVYLQAKKMVDANIFQIGLFEDDRFRTLIRVVDGVHKPALDFRLTPDAPGIAGWVRQTRQNLRVDDFDQEHDILPAKPRYVSDVPPKSGVYVPLQVGDVVVGVITIQSWRRAAFSESDVRRLTIIASFAAAAME